MPNFLLIGAGKSGTSSIYSYLKQHPEIYMSPLKEPNFFSFEGENINNYSNPAGKKLNQKIITDLDEYTTLFSEVNHEKVIGEASPSYIYYPKASKRIKYYIPHAKIIAILRHPVDKAYSNYLMYSQRGEETIDFIDAVREEQNYQSKKQFSRRYLAGGFYYKMLKHYFDKFDRKQIKILLYEDLKDNPVGLMQDIYEFLQVDYSFTPDTITKHNITYGKPKNQFIHRFFNVQSYTLIRNFFKPLFPYRVPSQLKLSNILRKNYYRPELSIQTRNELNQLFREDIIQLQNLIHRDLSKWL